MKPVLIIAIVAAAIIGVMFTPVSVYAETIEGENIGRNGIICITDPISTPQQDNRISVSLNAYAVNYDVNVIIQIDGKTVKNKDLATQRWTPVTGLFTISEKNSHTLGICLWKSAAGTDTRTLKFNDLNWDTFRIDPNEGGWIPAPQPTPQPTPSVEKYP
ncbi:MAG: hypothetical protein HOD60_09485, partial [Candidatus Nitrosopelagicus sp.]|nr:hypothetical protein [Candidatus Nitrosopelagicus sp.]